MSRTHDAAADVREDVEALERELDSAVRAVGVVVRQSMSPTRWIRERPLGCLAGAFAFGWWLGSRGSVRGHSRGRG